MSKPQNKPIALAIGTAVATGTLVAGSLFSLQAMASGYMQDAPKAEAKAAEGKCGEGKCGEGMARRDAASGQATGKRTHKPHTMAGMDTDKDGRLSRAEFDAAHKGMEEKFGAHDGDGDGFITQAEMDKHHADMKKAKAEGKCGEGKCGEGKCGGKKADAPKDAKAAEGKCGEGKCGEGKCGGNP